MEFYIYKGEVYSEMPNADCSVTEIRICKVFTGECLTTQLSNVKLAYTTSQLSVNDRVYLVSNHPYVLHGSPCRIKEVYLEALLLEDPVTGAEVTILSKYIRTIVSATEFTSVRSRRKRNQTIKC